MIDTKIKCSAPEKRLVRGEWVENPCLHSIALAVAWSTSYADPQELNEKHPQWADYIGYSEWFRNRICVHLELPLSTTWDELYRILGILIETEYSSKKEKDKATHFGYNERLYDVLAGPMFKIFESEIKPLIVNRD